MDAFAQMFTRGIGFVRNNPQIIYTLFLLIVIPLAFFFTSEQFLKVARENQDRLERSRIGLLQDAFALLAAEHFNDRAYLEERISAIAATNETMTGFEVLGKVDGGTYPVIAALAASDTDTAYAPDPLSSFLLSSAAGEGDQTFAGEYFLDGTRYWRGLRAVTATSGSGVIGYVMTDLSMAQADAVSLRNIRNAYVVLGLVILLIIILLARQARIIDYATLYRRLKEVDQMKDDFVSMAAHELRSPLTVIRGYVDMLGEGEGLSNEGKGHLKNIDEAALRLNVLVGDILDVAKLQEGRMSFSYKTHDVSEDIGAVVRSFMKPAADKGLRLNYEKTPLSAISVDVDRFRQVLINLVGNAIKYTPKGEVTITTSIHDGRVAIRVSDTGMGISANDQQKLFQKFFRVKNEATQQIEGTGLGLWITAQIVKTMGGAISVESITEKGTDFIVSFPVVKA